MVIIRRRGDRILPEQLDIMCHWVEAREALRVNREANAPQPWTTDPLLSSYRWCNARRMDDRVSRWLLEWHQNYPEISVQNRVVAAVAGRLINWPPTLGKMDYPAPYNEPSWTYRMLERKKHREKVFTGAYIINGALGGDKILQVTQKVLTPLWNARRTFPKQPETMQEAWVWLNGKPGIGSFMAGQAVADLRYIHPELPWLDRLTWAPQGPGSKRGVNRLIGQPLEASMPYNEWLDVVRAAYARCAARLPSIYERLELMDQQNVFCEYDKYVRLTNGEGSVRSRYREFKGWT